MILDVFTAITGHHRKRGIRLLTGRNSSKRWGGAPAMRSYVMWHRAFAGTRVQHFAEPPMRFNAIAQSSTPAS